MSSTTTGSANSGRYLDFDEYVDLKLQKARTTIKTTDILVALAGVAAMFLAYVLVFVIFDQWVVSGGFSIGLRWVLLSALMLLTGAWLAWKVGLPYLRTVNRLYAAREIEKADPELKSNLLNLVDLRSSGRTVDPAILRALEKNAAVGLQNVDVSEAVDHRPLMRMAYILLAVVVLFCLYALFSPKKISSSIWRSLLPAANVGVSTRTEIIKVEPGDATVLARSSVEIKADIAGEVPEKVTAFFTTADGKFRDEPIELRTDNEGPTRFKGLLRGESAQGLLQDLTYVVRAGDAESPTYRITVTQPPSATVDRIRIQYPAYMKLDSTESVGGQIDSWEGTKVSLTAHTNIPVKSAMVELLDDREASLNDFKGEEYSLTISNDGRQLSTSWALVLRSDGTSAKFYRIRCRTESGEEDPKPTVYSLNIRPDLPPDVSFLEPVRDQEVPANIVVPLLIEARDPDFELSHINLIVKKNGQLAQKQPLSEGRQQRLLLKHDLKLSRFDLKPGDLVEISVQAFDNKQPRPNSKVTPELKLKIVEPVSEQEAQKKQDEDQQNRDQRMKEAQQDQNPDARAEQQPPKEATGDDVERNPREQHQPKDEPMPQEKDPAQKQTANESAAKSGEAGKPQKSKGGTNEQKQPQPGAGEGDQSKSQPLSPTGEDDQTVLQKLIEKLNGEKNQKPSKQQSPPNKPENDKKSDSTSGQSEETNPPQSEGSSGKNKEKSSGNSESTRDNESEKENKGDQPKSSKPMPKPNGGETENSENPMPGNQENKSPSPKQGQQTGDSNSSQSKKEMTEDGNQNKPGPKQAQQKEKTSGPNETGKPESGDKSNENSKPEEGSNPEGTGDRNQPPSKPESGSGPQPNQDPNQKPGPMGAGEGPAEKGPAAVQEPSKEGAKKPQGNGDDSDSKSPMNDGKGPDKKGPADGPQEQTGETPNAVRKDADGTETGVAKPDRDPNSKATPSENPDLKRDPNEKPAVRPGAPKPNESNSPAKNTSDTKVKNPSSTSTDTKPEKIDQQVGDKGETTGKKEQKRPGDPNTPPEKMATPGKNDPRSKSGDGGQGGSSKEDKEGDPGSQKSGEGDGTNRPGEQQPMDKKTDQGQSNPGDGRKSDDAGKKKEGAGKANSENKSDKGSSSDQQKGQGDKSSKSGEKGGKGDEQEGKQGQGESSESADGKPSSGGSQPSPGKGPRGKQGNPSDKQGSDVPAGAGQAGPNANNTGGTESAVNDGEEANLEFKKQATELVLKRLQDGLERGDISPELLKELGWTEDQMRQFTDRLNKHLQEAKSTDESPESLARRQQFEETLKNLDVNKKGTIRKGDNEPQRDVNTIDSRRGTVPKEYRSASEKFSREVNRQKNRNAPQK